MKAPGAASQDQKWVRRGLCGGIVLDTTLVVYGLVRYPVIAGPVTDLIPYLLALVLLFFACSFLALWGTRRSTPARAGALREGTRFGLILGGLWTAQVLIENLAGGGNTLAALVVEVILAVVLVLMVLVGVRGAQQTGRIGAGALAGLWSGLISGLITFLTILLMTYLFMDVLLHSGVNARDFARNPGLSPTTVLLQESLAASSNHLLLVGLLLGTGLGALGGVIGKRLADRGN